MHNRRARVMTKAARMEDVQKKVKKALNVLFGLSISLGIVLTAVRYV